MSAMGARSLTTPGPGRDGGRWTTPAVLALAAAVAAAGIAAVANRPPEVAGFPVEPRDLVQTVVGTGRVSPAARLRVGGTLLGVLATANAPEGKKVRKGDLLASYVDAELKAAEEAARVGVAQAELRFEALRSVGSPSAQEEVKEADAALTRARDEYERAETLFAKKVSSRSEWDEARTALELARSRHQKAMLHAASLSECGTEYRMALASEAGAQAALSAAQARLALTVIASPADATVLRATAEAGDVVSPGQVLFDLAIDGPTFVCVSVDEKNLAGLEPGKSAVAFAEAFPVTRFRARVDRIAPLVDAARGTVEVWLVVDVPPAFLRADMTVSVEMELQRRTGAVAVPLEAVRDAASRKPWVLVARGGRAERRDVEIGLRGDDGLEVRTGLQAGEVVLLPGALALEPGRKVRVRTSR
jgi:HlyD family secretion protein